MSPASPTARSTPIPSGRPRRNVDIRIADNGEVLFRSPGMFVGYFKDDEKTAGGDDAGRLREDRRRRILRRETGHLKIIDRAKDVGQLKDGTLFPPKYVENKLEVLPEHQARRWPMATAATLWP